MRFEVAPLVTRKDVTMLRPLPTLAALALIATTAYSVSAQTSTCTPEHAKMGHCKMTGATPATGAADTASTKAFKAANDKMHAEMGITFSGNADVDFVKGMIPHHQGAVDMAKIVLQYGKDPALKKLAADIIKAQDQEIAFMKAWLAKNAKN
jgi:uncharacterized protein (DUF305 family)